MFHRIVGIGAAALLALGAAGCSSNKEPEAEAKTDKLPAVTEGLADRIAKTDESSGIKDGLSKAADKSAEGAQAEKSAEKSQDGGPLDRYIQLELDSLDPDSSDLAMYSDYSVTPVYPSGVIFSYTYKDPVDAEAVAEIMDMQLGQELQEVSEESVFPLMESLGVPAPQSVTFSYFNADGSEVWSGTYTSE